MSKVLFRVKYQLKWDDSREWGVDGSMMVLATDAERAIVAARKDWLGSTADPDEGDDRKKPHKVTGFRLIGVEPITTVDVIA
jgi:hypothetical protein